MLDRYQSRLAEPNAHQHDRMAALNHTQVESMHQEVSETNNVYRPAQGWHYNGNHLVHSRVTLAAAQVLRSAKRLENKGNRDFTTASGTALVWHYRC